MGTSCLGPVLGGGGEHHVHVLSGRREGKCGYPNQVTLTPGEAVLFTVQPEVANSCN